MTGAVFIDGERRAPERAVVSVFDRGFLYGDSVFETLRTYGGVPFALDEHLSRLERSAESVLIALPIPRAALEAEVRSAVDAAGYAESYVRVLLTRGRGTSLGLDPALAEAPLRVVIVQPLVAPPPEKYEAGIRTISYRTQRIADGTSAAGAKLGNYLVAVLATHAARTRGAEEALLVDAADRVLEGATSNVFGISGDRLITPPEEVGILAGITRAHLLDVAGGVGFRAELRALPMEELFTLDELFVSSSIRELLPVVAVDDRAIGSGRPGAGTRRLLEAFRQAARRSVARSG